MFDTKGLCIESKGDKFIIEDRSENCFRCVVIHEKHPNVLQYKETSACYNKEPLDKLCSQISGDAPLYSMFKVDAAPVACPFTDSKIGGPPFTFTYNRGSVECGTPTSRADACTEDSRLLLRFQACPDVLNTESTVEELECLADWKDGSSRYLVGRLEHKTASSDEDKYRCFMWEVNTENGNHFYQVAQSGDASCSGILSPTEGSRTIKLSRTAEGSHHHRSGAECRFPGWLTEKHVWHTLDHSRSYHFNPHNTTFRVTSKQGSPNANHQKTEMKAVCHSKDVSSTQATFVVHVVIGCQSGYMCMVFYKRVGHVVELQRSHTWTQLPEDACSPQNFNPQTLPFTTLVTSTPKALQCPYLGRYVVSGAVEGRTAASSEHGLPPENICDSSNTQTLSVGCGAPETMEFQLECNSQTVSAYSCHGHWTDDNTSYLIALPLSRNSTGARRYCFVIYNTAEGGGGSGGGGSPNLQVTSVTETCHRNIIANGHSNNSWAFNITPHGQCSDSGSRSSISDVVTHLSWILINLILIRLIGR